VKRPPIAPAGPCEFAWTMDVEDADFYAFEVEHRGGPSFSREELVTLGWVVGLSR
jgi:hypothetical protein